MRSMGREYEYTWKIVQHDPPKRMAVESTSGPFPTTLDLEFTGRDGETDVTATVTSWPIDAVVPARERQLIRIAGPPGR
jgi:hypothetical protein